MKIYGKNVALEALKENKKVHKIYLSNKFKDEEILSLIERKKISTKVLDNRELDKMCKGLHQGIMIDMDYSYSSLNELLQKNPENIIILDHLEDPHNLGAIIRTAAASSFDGVIIPKDREVGVTSTVVKDSVGTIFVMDVVKVTNI